MPLHRPSREVWAGLRREVLKRHGFRCVRCGEALTEDSAHIDHIQSGKRSGNRVAELRSLCRRCHVLRADTRHRGMIASALKDGIIPPDWRGLVWDD